MCDTSNIIAQVGSIEQIISQKASLANWPVATERDDAVCGGIDANLCRCGLVYWEKKSGDNVLHWWYNAFFLYNSKAVAIVLNITMI